MVDVSTKVDTVRTAVAAGRVLLGEEAFALVAENKIRKGDVLGIAQVAGILGAKQTSCTPRRGRRGGRAVRPGR